MIHHLRSALHILHEVLREIFDENAYHRYLARANATASRQSYSDFQREIEATRAQQPRCC